MANISEDAIVLRPDDVKGHVQFRDVCFGYPDKAHAIQHIDLNVPAGSIIGILGGTGSGKSTIISLLMRAYNVKEGSIFLAGIDIKDVTISSL
ncbi:ATP-binding cassette domain-containing protein [Paenibacillus larvae]|nr:ATP-binding cassette domain-containing protein [Paenibacillus larvae]MCY9511699.1 ATP-binding cassette domain-containing protein [Paenibacillus larvae]MCY9525629.1 ATP-binding cassette domain-containing protein [Paenibacillus larvae]